VGKGKIACKQNSGLLSHARPVVVEAGVLGIETNKKHGQVGLKKPNFCERGTKFVFIAEGNSGAATETRSGKVGGGGELGLQLDSSMR